MIADIKKLAIVQLKGEGKKVGVVQILDCRGMVIEWTLTTYRFSGKVIFQFKTFKDYDECYPSGNVLSLAAQVKNYSGPTKLRQGVHNQS